VSDLMARARERAEAQGQGGSDDWGYRLALEEGGEFLGRFRGETTDPNNADQNGNPRRIFLLWDEHNQRCYSRSYAALNREIDQNYPSIGATIAIVRGKDYVSANGTGYSFGVVTEANPHALPSEIVLDGSDGDDIPF